MLFAEYQSFLPSSSIQSHSQTQMCTHGVHLGPASFYSEDAMDSIYSILSLCQTSLILHM